MTLVLAGQFVLLRGADFCPAMKVGCGYEHVGQVPRFYCRECKTGCCKVVTGRRAGGGGGAFEVKAVSISRHQLRKNEVKNALTKGTNTNP